ncbi:hypothetical protein NC653_002668 [Populus alba x Populus x berolinensis]|uniref:Uncharacterized protein n=1 Tax=Populus alba x Populus x berolinensis TaxID=444605 RepID=A0AAD6RPH1_9ROSI|nr:hypothetical protein NC653_002668 [Populus alba x Populus x berolinensis]
MVIPPSFSLYLIQSPLKLMVKYKRVGHVLAAGRIVLPVHRRRRSRRTLLPSWQIMTPSKSKSKIPVFVLRNA